jgi:tetratricopeptide (TPR) repeat protein
MGMLLYYLIPFALSYAVSNPFVALLAVGALVFRRSLPDPVVWLGTITRVRRLETEIESNPANATARRDLARIYLDRGLASRALKLLGAALERFPDDAELLYLVGRAHAAKGNDEASLEFLVRCVDKNPALLYGEPYRVATEALLRLRRYEHAVDSADRFLGMNGSSLRAYRLLAEAQQKLGDARSAEATRTEAAKTWRALPGYKRRGQWSDRALLVFGV